MVSQVSYLASCRSRNRRIVTSEATCASWSPLAGANDMPIVVSRQGLARPWPPPASSTNPYFASWRRWNEQVVGDSPIRSPASVAVCAPPCSSASSSAFDPHSGCASSARSVRASVTFRGGRGPVPWPAGAGSLLDISR